jgi:hypothetical protein
MSGLLRALGTRNDGTPRRTDPELRQRIGELARRGADPALNQLPTVAEVVDVVGDLTLREVARLVQIAAGDHDAAIVGSVVRRA